MEKKSMQKKSLIGLIFKLSLFVAINIIVVSAQTTEFSFQGLLTDNSASANGNFDFEFRLFEAATGGTSLGSVQRPNVVVTNGVFSVVLDFGAFPPANRFLEISVRPEGGALTTLAPRSKLLSTPYATNAINAQNAANAQSATNATTATTATNAANAQTAQNALQLGGVAATQFVRTDDSRLSDARPPIPGSPNYIQNSTATQTATNFNISGNGTTGGTLTGNIVSATTQFNIGGAAVLKSPGSFNFFAGVNAGFNNTTGTGNSFFGTDAGVFNTTGSNNAYFGFEAGRNNNAGANNSYFGRDAGRFNTTGSDNAFFGKGAGAANTVVSGNSFFGARAGNANTIGSDNAFFGIDAGASNTASSGSSFFGARAGRSNTIGGSNTFFGFEAGSLNTEACCNSLFGFNAGKLNTSVRNSFFGNTAGQDTTTGQRNTFIGDQSGLNNTTGSSNTFVGQGTGFLQSTGNNNTLIGVLAGVFSNLQNASAIGAKALVSTSNSLVLGSINGINGASSDTNVGIGTTAPVDRLHVNGIIRVTVLGAAGSTSLCRNASNQISTCSSSLSYKTDISSFRSGLNLASKLQPIVFNWKDGGIRDLGLGAEDVEKVEPLLVTYNEKGEVEGVKYDRVAIVLLNAVKEQQVQIEQQRKQLQEQQNLIEGLRKIVCPNNLQAEVCK